jgi:hypothetical protein
VEKRLDLDGQRLLGRDDRRQQLEAGLDRSLGPAVLLGLERVHLDRHFGRRDEVGQEVELPALELRPVAQVEIFRQGVVLPAPGVRDGRPPPHAGRAVEVEEVPGAVPPAVLEDEVAVEQDRLNARQQRVVLVDVPPTGLHHRDLRIREVMDRSLQEVRGRDEIRVEDGDELAARDPHPGLERAGLVAGTIGAVEVLDVDALQGRPAHGELGDAGGLIGRVVEHLDLEAVPRVIDAADRLHQPLDDVHLVVNRELDRDDGQFLEPSRRHRHLVLVLHVDVDKVVAVPPVGGEHDEDEEVRCQDQRF